MANIEEVQICIIGAGAIGRAVIDRLVNGTSVPPENITVGRGRLWQGEGKQPEAHDLLAPVYDWFTEGFGTADLKDAKALLDALA
ncbi:MAG: hypothetical protein VYA71_03840 [Pseudomonadota bacterium]|nr:hypothetical protein [Pseudomonadota bacterium]